VCFTLYDTVRTLGSAVSYPMSDKEIYYVSGALVDLRVLLVSLASVSACSAAGVLPDDASRLNYADSIAERLAPLLVRMVERWTCKNTRNQPFVDDMWIAECYGFGLLTVRLVCTCLNSRPPNLTDLSHSS